MLVLSRKTEQTIQIGDEITITVLKVKGNQVRLGISAPNDVRVVRGELVLELDAEEEPAEPSADESIAVLKTSASEKTRFKIERAQLLPSEKSGEKPGDRAERPKEKSDPSVNRIAELFPESNYQVHMFRSNLDDPSSSQSNS